ncbi:MAG: tetratricopeptide repeat protein [Acidobacteriota bacterium]|nr:tetratricopeptide repeat protein [Acidobacteriota bacterium]
MFAALTVFLLPVAARAQGGNSIMGHIFGLQRQPVPDIHVELMDEFNRTIARTRTNGAGYYAFYRVGSGRFKIRALPYGTYYQEQEEEVEIQNFSRQTSSGEVVTSGFSNEQKDIYLRPRREAEAMLRNETVFVQEIPAQAKSLYEKAVDDLNNKREKEGLAGLKSALEIFPKYYAALERLGTEYVRLGHFEAAYILLSVAVNTNPRGYRSWYGLSYSLYSLKKPKEALEASQKAIELNAFAAEPLLLAGVILRQTKRFQEAEKNFVKAKELTRGTLSEVHRQLGLLYGYDLKRYRDAAKELRAFLKAQPEYKDAENIKKLIKEFEDKAQAAKSTGTSE